MANIYYFFLFMGLITLNLSAQIAIKADRVFDGERVHENWVVIIKDNNIDFTGPFNNYDSLKIKETYHLKGMTLMPGLIEGHSHLLLHPYNESSWTDQVLRESHSERAIRGSVHAEKSLMAGITTVRDLGSEGAGYSDVSLKYTIDAGIIPGPRMLVAGPAIVATGSYGPKGFHEGVKIPLGADEASGPEVVSTLRRQLANGADFIKIYADYRWRTGEDSQPTFSELEIKDMVEAATSAGRYVVAHASTPEGMKRAILSGVETIEHGDGGTLELFKLMKEKGVAFCPTLAAGDAILQYQGWKKGVEPEPDRILKKKESFKLALESGVKIVFGGDVGVFSHGENYRELEMMVAYGMSTLSVLKAATSGNAKVFHLDKLGNLKKGFLADLIAVEGNPLENIQQMRHVKFVMKDGKIYKK